ncbi:MAG TPA: OmpA family protein [Blastocatellia bacterium]|nr:OmpA family protein [Blastocatellia bacterium]
METKRARWLEAIVLALALVASGSALAGASQNQSGGKVQAFPTGQKLKVVGFVLKREPDSFIMRDQSGVERAVKLLPSTEVKTHRKGAFRGGKHYDVTYILRGLRLEATGTANSEGQLVAEIIKFEDDDLRAAQSLEARVSPTEELAKENQARIAAAEEEARRLAREAEENAEATRQARAKAEEAMKSATMANNRINGLDDFDPVKTITVLFATGSSVLGPKGKATIDDAAAWVKTQNTKGWVVAVVGFADTTGNTAKNRSLSERRANAVIDYLVTKHNLPLQRLVQPFGYGDLKPVAENTTAEGRAKNRRVEIRLLVNKGIANTTT